MSNNANAANIVIIDEETGAIKSPIASKSDGKYRSKSVFAATASTLLLAVASVAWVSGGDKNASTIELGRIPETRSLLQLGDELILHEELGIRMSPGLSVRLIAKTGEKVQYANGDESTLNWHTKSDAAGVVPINPDDLDEGYVYMSNSEVGDNKGGVFGLYFDKDGNVQEYKALLTGTTDNCGGGLSPWNTWISCEEYEDGQCWQIDANGRAEATVLGGNGGRYESVAVDNTDPEHPVFFTTEDHEEGALRRFVANGSGWHALHDESGETTFLNILNDSQYEWTTDEDAARQSASQYYRNSEGISYHDGKLYFMAKKDHKLIILDLDEFTYEHETTGKKFYGEGSFESQPDQGIFGPTRNFIYFTEDGGNPGVFARNGADRTYYTVFQAIENGIHQDDETIGIALSPDNKRLYAGIQDSGYIFEFTRSDGLAFE